ncbi:MAG: type II toxin-antitoxin system Phd/YefM family antitoxin [Bacteroidota bacterium]|nr:type II toxin-antitoxin system Phd/YefM family antitoxin [Bacteroidota bacterium]
MQVISTREFRDNQKKYLDLVDQNERVIVQRGRKKTYELRPLSETEYIQSDPEIMESIRQGIEDIKEGRVKRIKDPKNIWESIL